MAEPGISAETLRLLKDDIDRAMEEMRHRVLVELYTNRGNETWVPPPPPTRWQRWKTTGWAYLYGWKIALRGVWQALLGQDVYDAEPFDAD